jgi:hypothetical protein
MLSIDEMPDDNADLSALIVEFPSLEPNSPISCPVSFDEIVDYLRVESSDLDEVEEEQLQFLRTAQVAEHKYWIWSFKESDGTDCYVTVSLTPDGVICTGYDENFYNLTPEQYMLAEYHQVL